MKLQQYDLLLNKESGKNYLRKKKTSIYETDNICITSPWLVYEIFEEIFKLSNKAEENAYMLALNSKGIVIGLFKLSMGSVTLAIVNPREVYIRALLVGAVGIIIVHNHPSQDVTPSLQDVKVTKRLKEAGELLGITLQDHIIIGEGYYSFKEYGVI